MKMKDRSSFKVCLPRVPADIGEKDIDDLFIAEFGVVYRTKRDTGRSYAFVEFEKEEDVKRAVTAGNIKIQDQTVFIEKALNDEERAAKKLKA